MEEGKINKKVKKNLLTKNEVLNKKLTENNFVELKFIQKETLSKKENNLFIESPTGSGKTLAYLLPIFISIIESKEEEKNLLKALIIAPTRELVLQIDSVIKKFNFQSQAFFDSSYKSNKKIKTSIDENTNILVSTPNIFNFLKKNPKKFKKIEFLILDEGDKLYSGFNNQINGILRFKFDRIFVVSATLNKLEALIEKIEPSFIKNTKNEVIPAKLENYFIETSPINKLEYLKSIIKMSKAKKLIVFFNTCASVDFFFEIFQNSIFDKKLYNFVRLHGRMDKEERDKIFSSLILQQEYVLFSTDLSARGIDFIDISYVVHFDIPLDPANTVHRSGRTARNEKPGQSFLFVMPSEIPFIKFLEFKKIKIEPFFIKIDKSIDLESLEKNIRSNEELEKLAVRSFVSYISSYKEYVLNYLIEFSKLDFDGLTELFFLRKIPKMPELKKILFKRFPRN